MSRRFWLVPVEKMAIQVSVRTRCGSELQPEEEAALCQPAGVVLAEFPVHEYLEPSRGFAPRLSRCAL
jgi:hypothetical protein